MRGQARVVYFRLLCTLFSTLLAFCQRIALEALIREQGTRWKLWHGPP